MEKVREGQRERKVRNKKNKLDGKKKKEGVE
jgi:hypothetical protein